MKNIIKFVVCAICGGFRPEDAHCKFCDAHAVQGKIFNRAGTTMARVVPRSYQEGTIIH